MSRQIQILIVEDDPVDAELLVMALERTKLNFEWQRVDNEGEFRAQLRVSVDLIFSDCKMPRFSALRGLEVLKESGLKIPFIVMSGSIDDKTAAAAMDLGATNCLTKGAPVDLKRIVNLALGEDAGQHDAKG